MFTTKRNYFRFMCSGGLLTLAAACAHPEPVPIVADMYFDKYSAAQSAGNGVEFCELKVEDFTPALVAQIRSNPNYERNLAIWLEQCPELALAFADFGTASVAGTAAPDAFGGEADFGGFVGIVGGGPGGGDTGGGDTGGGDTGGGDTGGGDTGGGDTGGGDTGGGDTGGGDTGGGDTGGGDTGGGEGEGDGKGGEGEGEGDGKGGEGTGEEGCACDSPEGNGNAFG
jgi:hypothetical protein